MPALAVPQFDTLSIEAHVSSSCA